MAARQSHANGAKKAMETNLSSVLQGGGGDDDDSGQLTLDWLNGDKKATKRVNELLAMTGLSTADVAAQALSDKGSRV